MDRRGSRPLQLKNPSRARDLGHRLSFVDPAHGGRGIGRALLDTAHDALREGGCTRAFLFTEERNTRARALYAAAGYQPDGSIRDSDFNGTPLREVRLIKSL